MNPTRAAGISVVFNVFQTVIKLVAAALTGSVSLLSEAIHSLADVAASVLAYFSIEAAKRPPDDEHPYGHGKIESLASFAEALLIFFTVLFVLQEAFQHLFRGAEPKNLESGIWILIFLAPISFFVSRYVFKVAEQTQSPALTGNAHHLRIDFYTTIGVLAALCVSHFTPFKKADPIFAIALAGHMAWVAWHLSVESVQQLIDRRLTDEDLEKIQTILKEQVGLISHHKLRSRLSGNHKYVELHAVVPGDWTVEQGHELADELESKIESQLAPCTAVIHIDPFDPNR